MRIRERFNPRAPCGARQPQQNEPRMSDLFQPTRPLRGATMPSQMEHSPKGISTHAPLAGRDAKVKSSMRNNLHFNPRAPCGARRSRRGHGDDGRDFNPRAPCGARRSRRGHGDDGRDFNPRAPCGARRSATTPCEWMTAYFNPRAPCGARQRFTAAQAGVNQISTHAPLAGRDRYQQQDQRARQYFNPRAPLRGDRGRRVGGAVMKNFNPRAPCGARRSARDRLP